MTTTTPDYSQELHECLKELHAAASPAPWGFFTEISPCDEHTDMITDANKRVLIYPDSVEDMEEEDSDIIVESRNALPALLAEIERLQERERILSARLARVNFIAPVTYQLALSAGQGVGA